MDRGYMDKMKRIIVLAVSILTVAFQASASSWEGSAMMGSYGDFPSGGYFAACNSFPRNTAVEVTNLETGKAVTVIIVRGLDNPGVFMMVSAEAAEALGLRQGKITRVRAVEPRSVSTLAPSAASRRSLDADFNPRLLAIDELKRMGYDRDGTPTAPAVVPVQDPARTPPAPDDTPILVSPSPVPRPLAAPATLPEVLNRPGTAQSAPDMIQLSLAEPAVPLEPPPANRALDGSATMAEGLPGLSDRVVAHELSAPARHQDQTLATLDWPELEADEIPDIVLERLMEPAQTIPATSLAEGEIIFLDTGTPSAVASETPSSGAGETGVALTQPEAATPAQVATPEAGAPEPVQTGPVGAIEPSEPGEGLPGEVIVVLQPTDLRPPVADAPLVTEASPERKAPDPVVRTPVPVEPAPVAPASRQAMATGTLEKGRHYIQVGAYRTEAAAAEIVSVLRMEYVIVVETSARSNSKIWRIFVGPLGRDESGMALLRVRSLGFKDAFLKVGG